MGFSVPEFSPSDNPIAHSDSLITRTLTFAYLSALNVRLLIWPNCLNFDWSMDAIPMVESIFDLRNLLTSAVYIAFGFAVLKLFSNTIACGNVVEISPPSSAYSQPKSAATPKSPWAKCDINGNRNIANNNFSLTHRANLTSFEPNNNDCYQLKSEEKKLTSNNAYRAKFKGPKLTINPTDNRLSNSLLLALLISILSFLPASNLLFYVGFVLAERVLYIPSIGYCLSIAILADHFSKIVGKKLTALALIILITTHGVQTWTRNYDWLDEESLYRSGIKYNPAKGDKL